MNRRSFIAGLLSLPFLRTFVPESGVPVDAAGFQSGAMTPNEIAQQRRKWDRWCDDAKHQHAALLADLAGIEQDAWDAWTRTRDSRFLEIVMRCSLRRDRLLGKV